MILSCEKCSTSYALDERLIPAAGAPVQCTRCGHVFTARVPPPPGPPTLVDRPAVRAPAAAAPGAVPVSPTRQTQPYTTEDIQRIAQQALERGSDPNLTVRMRPDEHRPPARSAPISLPGTPLATPREPEKRRPTNPLGDANATVPPTPPAPSRQTTQVYGLAALRDAQSSAPLPPRDGAVDPSSISTFPNDPERRATEVMPAVESLATSPVPDTDQSIPPRGATLLYAVTASSTPAPVSEAKPELPASDRRPGANITSVGAPVVLPPEAPWVSPGFSPEPGSAAGSDRSERSDRSHPAAGPQRPLGRAGLAVVALVVLAAAGIGYRLLWRRQPSLAPELLEARDATLTLLRRDDTRSRGQAMDQIEPVLAQHPDFVEGKALLTLALVLQLDDVRLQIQRLQLMSDEVQREITRYQQTRFPADWQQLVIERTDRRAALKKQSDPLIDRATGIDAQVSTAFKELEATVARVAPEGKTLPADAQRAVLRAQAVYEGVRGQDKAVELAERYRQLAKSKDGWAAVAYAEYAVNARATPESVQQAFEAIDEVRKADTAFLRTYVLAARLALAQKQPDLAIGILEELLLLRPEHDVGEQLRAWALERKAQQQP